MAIHVPPVLPQVHTWQAARKARCRNQLQAAALPATRHPHPAAPAPQPAAGTITGNVDRTRQSATDRAAFARQLRADKTRRLHRYCYSWQKSSWDCQVWQQPFPVRRSGRLHIADRQKTPDTRRLLPKQNRSAEAIAYAPSANRYHTATGLLSATAANNSGRRGRNPHLAANSSSTSQTAASPLQSTAPRPQDCSVLVHTAKRWMLPLLPFPASRIGMSQQ